MKDKWVDSEQWADEKARDLFMKDSEEQRKDVERFAARARELMREWSKAGFEVEVPSRTVTELEAWKFLAYFTALCERLAKEHAGLLEAQERWNAMWEMPFDWSKEKLQ